MTQDTILVEKCSDVRNGLRNDFERDFPIRKTVPALSRVDVERLVHELKVHEIELEVQNEELRRAQEQVGISRDRYCDLYDFAPVGYFTLDRQGLILEVNLTGAMLVERDRSLLTNKHFQTLLAPEHADIFHLYQEDVFDLQTRQTCEIKLLRSDETSFDAHLESVAAEDGEENVLRCRMIVTDISDRKRSEKELKRREERLRASLREKEALLREIHHRVKNNLAVIHSLVSLQCSHGTGKTLTEVCSDLQSRIRAMSLAHEILYQSDNLGLLDVREYLRALMNQLSDSILTLGTPINLETKIQHMSLSLNAAIPVGCIIAELVTNCFKHAFPHGNTGNILISFRNIGEEEFELTVKDDGIGIAEDIDLKNPQTMGLDLIGTFVKHLQGRMEINRKAGTEVRISFQDK
jgi:PAS domain S-box-containing protein